jgi:hypothetical protein
MTYQISTCAAGCAFHSTVGGTCGFCHGPLTAPRTCTRDEARAILLGGQRYDAGKAAVLAWLAGAR